MSTELERTSWVQCTTCGKIYQTQQEISIEELYVVIDCSVCGDTTGLNLGDNEDDIYLYMCENYDPRYY